MCQAIPLQEWTRSGQWTEIKQLFDKRFLSFYNSSKKKLIFFMGIKRLIEYLKKQDFPIGEYAVFGSAVLAVRGIREAPNIDVIVTDKLWEDLISKNYEPDEEGFIRIGPIKISNWWFAPTRKDIPTMIKESQIIEGVPFVKIEDVLFYKKGLNREKDICDVKLIEKWLEENGDMVNINGHVLLGVNDYQEILSLFVEKVKKEFKKAILSLILFGSVARGKANNDSDLDIFVFFDDKMIKREEVGKKLALIIYKLRKTKQYRIFKQKGISPEVYPFLISKSRSRDVLWVFLDALKEGIILYDLNDFGRDLINETKSKIFKSGGRRVELPNGKWCWVLYRNFQQIFTGINL